MCARTRQISDAQIAQVAADLLTEAGPDAVSFAEVSQRCGLAPPTLVQRFGSKPAMVAAAVQHLQLRLPALFAETSTGIEGLITVLSRLASEQRAICRLGPDPETAAYSLELRKQISYSLTAAVNAGELPHCDVAQLARAVQLSFAGAVAAAGMEGADPRLLIRAAIRWELDPYI